jgi:hypothetical protein
VGDLGQAAWARSSHTRVARVRFGQGVAGEARPSGARQGITSEVQPSSAGQRPSRASLARSGQAPAEAAWGEVQAGAGKTRQGAGHKRCGGGAEQSWGWPMKRHPRNNEQIFLLGHKWSHKFL